MELYQIQGILYYDDADGKRAEWFVVSDDVYEQKTAYRFDEWQAKIKREKSYLKNLHVSVYWKRVGIQKY